MEGGKEVVVKGEEGAGCWVPGGEWRVQGRWRPKPTQTQASAVTQVLFH